MDSKTADLIKKNHGDQGSDLLQLVSFRIGSEEFGVDILQVQEIIRMAEITRVPQAPEYVVGVINLRGKIIPIINLRQRLKLDLVEHDKDTRIVVVDISGNIAGMIVDSVSEVLRLPADRIEPPPDMVTSVDADFVRGVAKLEDRLLMFLDLTKVVNATELESVG